MAKSKMTVLADLEALDAMAVAGTITPKEDYFLTAEGITAKGLTAATYQLNKASNLGNAVFYTPTIVASPDVAGGSIATSMSFTIPAGAMADGDVMAVAAVLKAFTTDGVVTEKRDMIVNDTVTPVTTQMFIEGAMPNNVYKYLASTKPDIITRVGTHLYYASANFWNATDLITDFENGTAVSSFTDLGTPDFTKAITISIAHTLSDASEGAIIKCLYAEIKHLK